MFGRTKPIELAHQDYMLAAQKTNDYVTYKATVGSAAAQAYALSVHDQALRKQDALGFYEAGATAKVGILPHPAILKFKDENAATAFKNNIGMPYKLDNMLIEVRQDYLNKLKKKAQGGQLRAKLTDANLENEASYYMASGSKDWGGLNVQQKIKAWPPVAAGAASKGINAATEKAKAKGWLAFTKIPEAQGLLDEYAKANGTWPLGEDTAVLLAILKKLEPNPPAYRIPTMGSTYPSNFGGTYLLNTLLSEMAVEKLPLRGDPRWQDWALYVFGGAMAAQAMTDANKRVCRTAYAILLVTAGIEFRAPTPAYGRELANM